MFDKMKTWYLMRFPTWGVLKEKILFWVVWKLPKRIIYFSTIRLGAYATTGKHGNTIVPELSLMDALKRYEKE